MKKQNHIYRNARFSRQPNRELTQRKPTNLKVSKQTKKVYKFTEILDSCKANDPTSLTAIGQEVTSRKPTNNRN